MTSLLIPKKKATFCFKTTFDLRDGTLT